MKKKIKTVSSAKKRFNKISSKKYIYKKAFNSHNLEKKSKSHKCTLTKKVLLCLGDKKKVYRMIPNY